MAEEVKPGRKTSEFVMAAIIALCGFALSTGWITPEIQNQFVEGAEKVMGGLAMIAVGWKYIASRAEVKKAQKKE